MTHPTETNQETLQNFVHQLLNWCRERLRDQPGPFRQAEICTELIAESSLVSSPLVLWVNRESLQAGSVILFPGKIDPGFYGSALATARALGLPFFFLWDRTEISFWSATGETPVKTWRHILPDEDISSPAGFRKTFNTLLDEAEKSFFIHQVDIPSVTETYLANLIHVTFLDLLLLFKRKTENATTAFAESEMKSSLFHRLLLPIALAVENRLPRRFTPETLNEEIPDAAWKLSPGLRSIFTGRSAHIEIPQDCQRRLSLYVNRIGQLGNQIIESSSEAVRLLLARWANDLGGAPFSFIPAGMSVTLINPDRCLTNPTPELEVGSPGILAATALIRYFTDNTSSKPIEQYPDCLKLEQTIRDHQIVGTLHDERFPTAPERKRLNAFLRISWPNYKLDPGAKTPVWVWHFLHICGLATGESRLELRIPKSWLWEKYGRNLLSHLHGKLVLKSACDIDGQLIQITLVPDEKPVAPVVQSRDGRERKLRQQTQEFLRSHLLLSLLLPDPHYRLLETGELGFRTREECMNLSSKGLQNYCYSSLGRGLWKLLAPGKSLPRGVNLTNKMAEHQIPLPNDKVLTTLARLETSAPADASETIDLELASWFGLLPELRLPARQATRKSRNSLSSEDVDIFLQRCNSEEVPVFPDYYLYDIPSKDRIVYRFDGPLKIVDTFFDETILEGHKEKITVRGKEHAEALVMVSLTRSGDIELPRNETTTREILDRYRRDLENLHRTISEHAGEFTDHGNASSLVERAWKELGLPDWKLIDHS